MSDEGPWTFYQSPNDSPRDGTIHPLGRAQLAQWQAIAEKWPYYSDFRCVRCGDCGQSMWFRSDPKGLEYQYTDDENQALIVAHIRQNHAEVINGTVEATG